MTLCMSVSISSCTTMQATNEKEVDQLLAFHSRLIAAEVGMTGMSREVGRTIDLLERVERGRLDNVDDGDDVLRDVAFLKVLEELELSERSQACKDEMKPFSTAHAEKVEENGRTKPGCLFGFGSEREGRAGNQERDLSATVLHSTQDQLQHYR